MAREKDLEDLIHDIPLVGSILNMFTGHKDRTSIEDMLLEQLKYGDKALDLQTRMWEEGKAMTAPQRAVANQQLARMNQGITSGRYDAPPMQFDYAKYGFDPPPSNFVPPSQLPQDPVLQFERGPGGNPNIPASSLDPDYPKATRTDDPRSYFPWLTENKVTPGAINTRGVINDPTTIPPLRKGAAGLLPGGDGMGDPMGPNYGSGDTVPGDPTTNFTGVDEFNWNKNPNFIDPVVTEGATDLMPGGGHTYIPKVGPATTNVQGTFGSPGGPMETVTGPQATFQSGRIEQQVDPSKSILPEKFSFGYDDFEETPYYQFLQDEGSRAIDRSAAARGGLASGGTLAELQDRGQAIAGREFGDQFNRALDTYGTNYDRYQDLRDFDYGSAFDRYNIGRQVGTDDFNRSMSLVSGTMPSFGNQLQSNQAFASGAGNIYGQMGGASAGAIGGMQNSRNNATQNLLKALGLLFI